MPDERAVPAPRLALSAVAALIAHIHDNHPVLSSWPEQPASS